MGPTETGVIVGQAAAQGYQGKFIGIGPTWNPALLESPAARRSRRCTSTRAPGGTSARTRPATRPCARPSATSRPSDGYTAGWVWSYPLKAALEEWLDGDFDQDRAGLVEAAASLETVDYEGMLPEEAGNYAGEPNEAVFRRDHPREGRPGSTHWHDQGRGLRRGPNASDYEFTGSCFERLTRPKLTRNAR